MMEPIWQVEYPLRANDFDRQNHLQPASILDLFQDAAGRHSIHMGVGMDTLGVEQKTWIVSSVYYQVVATPTMYQQVRLKTWPLKPSMVVFPREYVMEDIQGNVLVRGSSQWAVIDREKRKILPSRDVYPQDFPYHGEQNFPQKLPRLKDFEPVGEGITVTPAYSSLDFNGHVNNTKYANFVLDGVNLPQGTWIRSFHLHYRKELLPHQPVTLFVQQNQGEYWVMGKNRQGETMFHCHLTTENLKF